MIPAWVLQLVEALAYGFSRGWWRAYFDVIQEGTRATEEPMTDADKMRLDLFRRAVADAARVPTPGTGPSGPPNPPPAGG